MSQNLLKLTDLANNTAIVFVVMIFLAVLFYIIKNIVIEHYNHKQRKLSERESKDINIINKEKAEIYLGEESPTVKMASYKNISDKVAIKQNEYKNKYKKIQDKKEAIILFTRNMTIIWLILFCFIFYFLTVFASCIGGKVDTLHKVTNVENEGVVITAYYIVEYKGVDQKTVTVFVKNNSNKALESACIVENKTNEKSNVEYIEPGQEKIVSFEIYPEQNDDYNFKIEDVKFKE